MQQFWAEQHWGFIFMGNKWKRNTNMEAERCGVLSLFTSLSSLSVMGRWSSVNAVDYSYILKVHKRIATIKKGVEVYIAQSCCCWLSCKVIIRGLAVKIPAPTVHKLKCPWARH